MYKNFLHGKRESVFLSTTESTNNELKKMIYKSEAPLFSSVSAETQLCGRGRLGRSFFSPSGGLYFSFSLPLRGDEKNIPFITLLAGLSVMEAVRELTGTDILIKWPNDIYYEGRKLGGILCELVSGRCLTAVVGTGLNLTLMKDEIPQELKDKMTSFVIEGIKLPDKKELMGRIIENTDKYIYEYNELFSVRDETMQKLRECSYSIGKKVKYTLGDTVLEGIVTDIKKTGAAEILLSDGTKKEIFCGEIV